MRCSLYTANIKITASTDRVCSHTVRFSFGQKLDINYLCITHVFDTPSFAIKLVLAIHVYPVFFNISK